MAEITSADIVKLRKSTGAGMMDCKHALQEANGDFDKAVEIIRKKGKLVASKRADREANQGVVLSKVAGDMKSGVMIVLNCETDFVAKNQDFIGFAVSILNLALEKQPQDLEMLKTHKISGKTVNDAITEQIGIIGEKIDLSFYQKLAAEHVTAYIHPGNKLASLVGLNKPVNDPQIGKDIAMQVAAMDPVAVNQDQVPRNIIEKEIEIGKDQARQEGKPEEILEKIATGKLNKFFKERTLINQQFIKDNKKTVQQYIREADKDLAVTGFVRYALTD
ncbi:MAG: elongation factor Ts [Bacteroides sp. SM23_62_1]|nr:MAG: elongation factor Ts [Bacteroides sp. SM23_62_1]